MGDKHTRGGGEIKLYVKPKMKRIVSEPQQRPFSSDVPDFVPR